MRPARLGVSLRTRLTLWYGALLALTLLGFSTLFYFTLQESLRQSVDERLSLRADRIGHDLGPKVGKLLQPEDVAPDQVEPSPLSEFVAPGIYVQLLNARGAVVVPPPNLPGGELPVTEGSRRAIASDQRTLATVPDANVRVLTVPLHNASGEVAGAVQVGESLSPLANTLRAVAGLLLSAGAGALIVAVVLGWLFTRSALSPVARVTATARHIAATGDYRQRLPVAAPRLGRGDELFFLAATFNDMIARLEHMLESQRRLLADTSHELRSPLTVIRGNLALLRRDAVPDEARREAVLEADEEATRMARLVADLLLLARADAGDLPSLQREPVDLVELASDVVEQAQPAAGSRVVSLSAAGGRGLVLGDRDRLKQLVANLVENALRYTPEGGQVRVSVAEERRVASRPGMQHAGSANRSRSHDSPHGGQPVTTALLTVSDTGIGIAPGDLPHVFERFYRADKARSRAAGGSGLGLSIAQCIARAHGGRIEVTSAGPNRGSSFRVRLPLLAPELPEPAPSQAPPPRTRATPTPLIGPSPLHASSERGSG